MRKKSKAEKTAVQPKVSDSFARTWSAFANGDGTYKIQEIYTFSHMWYGRKDIRQKCKELLLGKKLSDKEYEEKLSKILIECSSPRKGEEKEYEKHVKSTDWTVILAKMREVIKQGG